MDVFHSNNWKGVEIFTGTELLLEKNNWTRNEINKKGNKGVKKLWCCVGSETQKFVFLKD